MKAILQYVQKVIASNRDGTICITIDTGETATLTVKKRSIVAASLEEATGKEALETIKLATVTHMEFWADIMVRSDIQKMIDIQTETNALSPKPKEEMFPDGVPLLLESDEEEENPTESEVERNASETIEETEELTDITEKDIEILTSALGEYIGPAANILLESIAGEARDMDHLISLLSEELYSDKERDEFSQKAYFLLNQS
ncbi:MAG: hypothetical protein GY697_04435 [Desulfobacterales bacterium]|nr:hypothetical protein [Desulfobacterales bacterium]